MNDLPATTLAQGTNGASEEGFLGLLGVQMLGVCVALAMSAKVSKAHGIEFRSGWCRAMQAVVGCVFVCTVVVGVVQGEALQVFYRTFKIVSSSDIQAPLSLQTAHQIIFTMDFLALGFLIYATGGAQVSLFSPFLFVLVPITIALGPDGLPSVLPFAGLTIVVFLATLWCRPPAYLVRNENTATGRKVCGSFITSVCVCFPTTVFLLQQEKTSSRQRSDQVPILVDPATLSNAGTTSVATLALKRNAGDWEFAHVNMVLEEG